MHVLRNLPFGFRYRRLLSAFAAVREELHRHARDSLGKGERKGDLASFRSLQADLLAPRLGMGKEEVNLLVDRVMYGELEDSFAQVRLYPGVVETLSDLAKAGFRLAALSDFPAPRKLELLGLSTYFEFALSSEESGFLKPASEPFHDLARRFGLPPSDILFVGNSVRLDVVGARSVGMSTALRSRRSERLADLVFTDWNELRDFALLSGPGEGITVGETKVQAAGPASASL
jgi:putative hydrolase of the HAD superfamily